MEKETIDIGQLEAYHARQKADSNIIMQLCAATRQYAEENAKLKAQLAELTKSPAPAKK